MFVLAGDIGGTNARLICSEVTALGINTIAEVSYLSADYKQFYDVLDQFLTDINLDLTVGSACFAIAGPVETGEVSVTNLPWVISEKVLKNKLNTRHVKLINDFIAVAHGVITLEEKDFLIIQKGEDSFHKDAVVLGAGTGLGASHIVYRNNEYEPLASEAGQVSFSPQSARQCILMSWLWRTNQYISLESILSGQGLSLIYQFLHEVENIPESEEIYSQFSVADPAEVITKGALQGKDELCNKTLQMFINIYGAAASNIILHYYPVSTLYIAGGIAPKIKDKMIDGAFLKSFNNKGLMTSKMKKITIKLVCQEKAGLFGALAQAISMKSVE